MLCYIYNCVHDIATRFYCQPTESANDMHRGVCVVLLSLLKGHIHVHRTYTFSELLKCWWFGLKANIFFYSSLLLPVYTKKKNHNATKTNGREQIFCWCLLLLLIFTPAIILVHFICSLAANWCTGLRNCTYFSYNCNLCYVDIWDMLCFLEFLPCVPIYHMLKKHPIFIETPNW